MERAPDQKQKVQTDGDRIRLIAEAIQDDELSDGACRLVIRSLLFPSRIDDATYKWACDQVERLGLLSKKPPS